MMVILFYIAVITLTLFLQVFLSKRKNKIFGLIIPIFFSLFSIVPLILGLALAPPDIGLIGTIGVLLLVIGVCNIPSLILYLIYINIRKTME